LWLAAIAAWTKIYGSFAYYDDEGYVMISLRSFLQGKPLYDATYSQYGPAYYCLVGGLHWLLDWPVTHDITRLKTLAVWLAASMVSGGMVGRVTRSRGWGLVAAVMAFLHLERLCMEPGHPQELCLLGVLTVLLAASWREHIASSILFGVVAGCAAGIVLATKVNMGVFLSLGVVLAIAAKTLHDQRGCVWACAVFLMSCALPWVLTRHYLNTWDGVQLATVVTAGLTSWWRWELCSGSAGNHCRPGDDSPSGTLLRSGLSKIKPGPSVMSFGVTALLVFALFTGAAHGHGTSWTGLYQGMFEQNLRFSQLAGRFGPLFPWAALSALLAVWASRRGMTDNRVKACAAATCLVAVLLQSIFDGVQPLSHGLQDRALARFLMSLVTPWSAWLLLRPEFHANLNARRVLVAAGMMQPLTAFPFAGTQMSLGSLPLLLIVVIATADSVSALQTSDHGRGVPEGARARQLGKLMVAAVALVLVERTAWLSVDYGRKTPLNLPGASWIRLPREEVSDKRKLVDRLRSSSDTFLCVQMGYNSLYFWTELPPPTTFNTTVWPYLLNADQQTSILRSLESYPRSAVVFDAEDPPPPELRSPVVDHVHEHFRPCERIGRWEIWYRTIPVALPEG
jgi:hypothetical protein